jgi:hypothetical protein
MYSLPDDNQTILVDGPGANLFATLRRAVLGGTGKYSGLTGEETILREGKRMKDADTELNRLRRLSQRGAALVALWFVAFCPPRFAHET